MMERSKEHTHEQLDETQAAAVFEDEVSRVVEAMVLAHGEDVGYFSNAVLRNWAVSLTPESDIKTAIVDAVVDRLKRTLH